MLFENEDDIADEEIIGSESEEENLGGNENENAPDISEHEEAVAKARGWVPKDQFRGKEDDWQDAKSFLDRNSSLQTDVKELRDRLSRQDEEYAERLKRIESANERIIQNDRQRLIDELEQAKRNAVELGDTEEYDRIRKSERDYYRRIAEESREPEREERPNRAPDLLPETQDWIRRNSWFNENQAMQQIALGFYSEALEGMPATRDENKRLAYVERKMAAVYPNKFGANRGGSSVESGSRQMSSGNNKMAQLTADERAACKRFIAKGLIKDEAEYIRYLNE